MNQSTAVGSDPLPQPAPILDFAWYPSASPLNPATFCFVASVRNCPVKLLDAATGRVGVVGLFPLGHQHSLSFFCWSYPASRIVQDCRPSRAFHCAPLYGIRPLGNSVIVNPPLVISISSQCVLFTVCTAASKTPLRYSMSIDRAREFDFQQHRPRRPGPV
jgi:hypothetical protein